ncbi:hypothetical protein F5B17DRAFT_449722 [Nemania serpens]|nr:hypothetical protein F5B17DRAFT_449722 [Nemania serpens]
MAAHKSLVLAAILFFITKSFMHVVAATPAHPPDADHKYVVVGDHHRICNGTLGSNGTFGGNGTAPSCQHHPPYCVCYTCCMSKGCRFGNATSQFNSTEKVIFPLPYSLTSAAMMIRTSNTDRVAMLASAMGLAWFLAA